LRESRPCIYIDHVDASNTGEEEIYNTEPESSTFYTDRRLMLREFVKHSIRSCRRLDRDSRLYIKKLNMAWHLTSNQHRASIDRQIHLWSTPVAMIKKSFLEIVHERWFVKMKRI